MPVAVDAVAAVLRQHNVRGPAHDQGGCPAVYARQLAQLLIDDSLEPDDLAAELAEAIARRTDGVVDARAISIALEVRCAWAEAVGGAR